MHEPLGISVTSSNMNIGCLIEWKTEIVFAELLNYLSLQLYDQFVLLCFLPCVLSYTVDGDNISKHTFHGPGNFG